MLEAKSWRVVMVDFSTRIHGRDLPGNLHEALASSAEQKFRFSLPRLTDTWGFLPVHN